MARSNRKKDTRGPVQRLYDAERVANDQSYLDVITPEQLQSGCYENHRGGRRFFRLTHLDRLHKNGKLTYEQHQAGTHYRNLWDLGRYDTTRTMDLDRVRGQELVTFTLPTRAQDARDQWRAARREVPKRMVGFTDRLLLRDEWPSVHHRQADRNLTQLRSVLDLLAFHFRLI